MGMVSGGWGVRLGCMERRLLQCMDLRLWACTEGRSRLRLWVCMDKEDPVGMRGHIRLSLRLLLHLRRRQCKKIQHCSMVSIFVRPCYDFADFLLVKALYDYVATIDEEFDFQAGDIIAVTSTPEDGWWTGHLLDEARIIPGKNVFPSNFVCLF